jgi:predicted RNA binding protein YcfA (HicA-like mRNA interferase family)
MSGRPRIRFRDLRKRLKELNIIWHPDKGKGSHGAFVGPDQDGRIQAFTLPRHQQSYINRDYLKALRRRFNLTGEKWVGFFESNK